MSSHQVQVDAEVFAFVKQHAEPLVDDFNTALRRLLPLGDPANGRRHARTDAPRPPSNGTFPSLPERLPQALKQILEVVHLSRSGGRSRTDATRLVAKHNGVFPQTIHDKYGRQMGLSAAEFDRLLDDPTSTELRRRLMATFPEHRGVITSLLG